MGYFRGDLPSPMTDAREAQLSQRGRATLHVAEIVCAKSLKIIMQCTVIQNYTVEYSVRV